MPRRIIILVIILMLRSGGRVGKTRHGIDSAVRRHDKQAGAAHAFLPIAGRGKPVGEHHAVGMPDLAPALKAHAGHEPLGGAGMCREVGQTIEQAEAVTEADIGGRDPGECVLPRAVMALSTPGYRRYIYMAEHKPGPPTS